MSHIRFALALAVLMMFSGTSLRAEDAAPDNDGFIRNWLLLAPIALEAENSGFDEIDKQQIKDEGMIKPRAGEKVQISGKDFEWNPVTTKDFYFDINEILKGTIENSVAYAVCYIDSPEELKELKLKMGSNDQGKVYLNGKEVVKFQDTRVLEKDENIAENVTLNKGVNTLVFKVINEMNNFQGCIRFTDKQNAPVKNYKVKLGL